MSIMVKSANNGDVEVASKGATTAALTTGIIGSTLGVLNGGLLGGNGLLGGGAVTQAEAAVGISKYYEDRISDLGRMNSEFTNVREAICNLRERVSVNETANAYQNRITEIGFSNTDQRFLTERKITDFEIQAAVCDFIPASKMLRPEQIGDPYHGVRLNMGYVRNECRPFNGGWDDGCGCNGYRGF